MSATTKQCSILIAVLLLVMAQSARAEDYLIEVIERPVGNRFDPTARTGRYKFRVKIHPNSTLERIDGTGKICVADTARFKWSLDNPSPQVPPLQSRNDSKEVEAAVKATGEWTGQGNVFFSVAFPGSNCAGNGLSPAGQSNRAQESVNMPAVPRTLDLPSSEPIQRPPAPAPSGTLPPYRLRVSPAANATSVTTVRFRAEPTGTGSSILCKFEAIPTSGGTAWSNVSTNCTESGTTLAAGTYKLRLVTRVARTSGGSEDLTEEKNGYVVTSPPNYTIPVLATELFNSKMYRDYGEPFTPCEFWHDLLADPVNASFGVICGGVYNFGKKKDREFNVNRKLQNGWRIKRIEVEKSEYLGDYLWLIKPTEGSDDPHMKLRYWVNGHQGNLTESSTKYIKLKVRIWIEGPSHLSAYKANEPRQSELGPGRNVRPN